MYVDGLEISDKRVGDYRVLSLKGKSADTIAHFKAIKEYYEEISQKGGNLAVNITDFEGSMSSGLIGLIMGIHNKTLKRDAKFALIRKGGGEFRDDDPLKLTGVDRLLEIYGSEEELYSTK